MIVLADSEFLPEDLLRERVLDELLDRPTQRTSAERRLVAPLRDELLGSERQLEADALTPAAARAPDGS